MLLKRTGNLIVLITVLFTLAIWYFSKVYYDDYFSSPYKYLAKIASLSGTILMGFSLILSTRLNFIEHLFGGLDNLYKAHANYGRLAFFGLILHPFFLWLASRQSFFDYFTPSFIDDYYTGLSLGTICLLLLFLLLYLTINNKLPYEIWQKIHKFFGPLYFLIVIHIVLVSADVQKYPLLRFWFYGFMIISLVSYIYTSFLKYYIGKKYTYRVIEHEYKNLIHEITLEPVKEPINNKPGQFTYLNFKSKGVNNEWHPFSIINLENNLIKFGIKELGDYTKTLNSVKVDDTAFLSGKYGYLYEKVMRNKDKFVFLGAGIGITPMICLFKYLVDNQKRENHIFYINNFPEQSTFDNDIINIMKNDNNRNFYTPYYDENKNYFNFQILKEKIPNFQDYTYYLCGPKPFTNSLIKALKMNGVKNSKIVTEEFDYGVGNKQWKITI